jgi:hypothetical protein
MIDFETLIRETVHNVFVKEGLIPQEAKKSVPAMGMTPQEDAAERRREDDEIKALEAKLRREQQLRDA